MLKQVQHDGMEIAEAPSSRAKTRRWQVPALLFALVWLSCTWFGSWAFNPNSATRLLADFGAEVIRIEDRNRLDMPRRLPIYKGEVRTYGEEDLFYSYRRATHRSEADYGRHVSAIVLERI